MKQKQDFKQKFPARLYGKSSGILILLVHLLAFTNNVEAQREKRISISFEQTGITDALRQINRIADNIVVFKQEETEKEKHKITLNLRDVTVFQAVDAVIKDCNLICMEYEDKIVIRPKTQARSKLISGKVKNPKGEPLPGATVRIKGSDDWGTATDKNGKFDLSVPEYVQTLVFSFIGYKTEEVRIGDRQILDIVLEEDIKAMEEVVVTGIFTRKAESYTGVARTLSEAEIRRVGNANIFESLKNLDPSLFVMDNFVQGSDPNALPELNLRGRSTFQGETDNSMNLKGNYQSKPNQPLFILDGFEINMEKALDIDINRIQCITILKDAAAKAIYGSKAANGVVVIETKRLGASGHRISYSAKLDIQWPDLSSYQLTNAREKLEVERIEGVYEHERPDISIDRHLLYNTRLKRILEGLDTYWLAKPLRTGIGQKHSLSVELGDKFLKTKADFSYGRVNGIMKKSYRDIYSTTLDISYRYRNLLFRNKINVTGNKSSNSPYGNFILYARMNPYMRAVEKDGKIPRYAEYETMTPNPLYDAQLELKNQTAYLDFSDNFFVEFDFLKHFKANLRLGINAHRNDADEYYPAEHSRFHKYYMEDVFRKGSYQINEGKSHDISGDFNLNYNRILDKHILFLNFGLKMSEKKFEETIFSAEGFPYDYMHSISFAKQYTKDSKPVGISAVNRDIALLGYLSYSYDDRYFSDLTLRPNAASVFGTENLWATFWSIGLGWNIHNEKWMKGKDFFRQLRLRASVGSTGNQNFMNNRSLATYIYYLETTYQGFIGAYLKNMENPGLKWEQKTDYNIGMDMKIGNLDLIFSYYIADTENMVTNIDIPLSTGFEKVSENLGKVRNRGIELSAAYQIWQADKGFLNVNFNITTNKNKILKISDAIKIFNENQNKIASEKGYNKPVLKYMNDMPMDAIWAVPSMGIDPSTGNEIYIKKNGTTTYEWDASDMVMAGTSYPKYMGNFGIYGEYRHFGFNIVCNFMGGSKMYNATLVDKVENIDILDNVDRRVLSGRWQQPGQKADFKRLGEYSVYIRDGVATTVLQEKTRATTRFVQRRNEMNISSISLYYDFNCKRLKNMGVERMRLSGYMNNIAVFSTIKTERGISYPFSRTASFQLDLTF